MINPIPNERGTGIVLIDTTIMQSSSATYASKVGRYEPYPERFRARDPGLGRHAFSSWSTCWTVDSGALSVAINVPALIA
jgi:hypothetical protein